MPTYTLRRRVYLITALVILLMLGLAGTRFVLAQEDEPSHPAGFEYAAKLVCGIQEEPENMRLARGFYATTVNIHNPNGTAVVLNKKLALTIPRGDQEPGEVFEITRDELGPDQALATDCQDIVNRVFGGQMPNPYFEGFVIIQSRESLDVTAVYSAAQLDWRGAQAGALSSIDVEQIRERHRAPETCVGFETLPVETQYVVGDSFAEGGLMATLREFILGNGVPTSSGYVEVQTGGQAGGSGNELMLNNINVAFSFGAPVSELSLRFGEYGGNVNLEVNGDFQNVDDFSDLHGTVVGGATVNVSPQPSGVPEQGVLRLVGPITTFVIGGQELWIDDLCYRTSGDAER